jgi:hypothetical protein
MTDAPTLASEKPATKAPTPAAVAVSGNPALVEWPRDEWGTLAVLRRELLLNASNIRGNDAKHGLFMQTLTVAAKHAIARFEADKAAVQAEGAAEEARIAAANRTGRVYAMPVTE